MISSLFSKSFCVTVQILYLNSLCAGMTSRDPVSKTFQIHKFLKTSSWVFFNLENIPLFTYTLLNRICVITFVLF